jgi:hypothetical protein
MNKTSLTKGEAYMEEEEEEEGEEDYSMDLEGLNARHRQELAELKLRHAKETFLKRLRLEMTPTRMLDGDYIDQLRREALFQNNVEITPREMEEGNCVATPNTVTIPITCCPSPASTTASNGYANVMLTNHEREISSRTRSSTGVGVCDRGSSNRGSSRGSSNSSSGSSSNGSSSSGSSSNGSSSSNSSNNNSNNNISNNSGSNNSSNDEKHTACGKRKRQPEVSARHSGGAEVELKLKDLAESLSTSLFYVPQFKQHSLVKGGAAIKRDVAIYVIKDEHAPGMIEWAKHRVGSIARTSFGVTQKELFSKEYWKMITEKGTSFCVALDGKVVGYIPCFNINNLDENGIPRFYGVSYKNRTSRKPHQNLACVGYLQSTARDAADAANMKGVMQFALRAVISWLFAAEARVAGVMSVIRVPAEDSLSQRPGVPELWERSRKLMAAMSPEYKVRVLRPFVGARMGTMSVHLLLRPDPPP